MINSLSYLFSICVAVLIATAFQFTPNNNIPQPKYTLGREYPFVNYGQNQILMRYPRTALKQLYNAFDDLISRQEKKVNIVHFGDSHIQADYFTNQVRSHFNDELLLGNGGRGYFFPCLLAQGEYSPYNI